MAEFGHPDGMERSGSFLVGSDVVTLGGCMPSVTDAARRGFVVLVAAAASQLPLGSS
jgi:hypothetical protein